MVTVVDCLNFFKDFGSAETLMDRELTDMEGDHRTIVNLLTDQIEFANVIILNKTDLVSPETIGVLKASIHKLNPNATIIASSFGKVAPSAILNTGLFDYDEAEQSAAWAEALRKDGHVPETEEYGISSFVFRDQRPFHAVPELRERTFPFHGHPKQGHVLDGIAATAGTHLEPGGRIAPGRQCGCVVVEHALLTAYPIRGLRGEQGHDRGELAQGFR